MRWTEQGTISRRLTWMNMLVSGFALLMACSSFVAYDLATFRQATARNLSTQAQIIGADSASALLFNDAQSAEKTLSLLSSAPNVVSAAIFTADGQKFASYQREQNGPALTLLSIPPGQSEVYTFDKGDVRLASSIVFQVIRLVRYTSSLICRDFTIVSNVMSKLPPSSSSASLCSHL